MHFGQQPAGELVAFFEFLGADGETYAWGVPCAPDHHPVVLLSAGSALPLCAVQQNGSIHCNGSNLVQRGDSVVLACRASVCKLAKAVPASFAIEEVLLLIGGFIIKDDDHTVQRPHELTLMSALNCTLLNSLDAICFTSNGVFFYSFSDIILFLFISINGPLFMLNH